MDRHYEFAPGVQVVASRKITFNGCRGMRQSDRKVYVQDISVFSGFGRVLYPSFLLNVSNEGDRGIRRGEV